MMLKMMMYIRKRKTDHWEFLSVFFVLDVFSLSGCVTRLKGRNSATVLRSSGDWHNLRGRSHSCTQCHRTCRRGGLPTTSYCTTVSSRWVANHVLLYDGVVEMGCQPRPTVRRCRRDGLPTTSYCTTVSSRWVANHILLYDGVVEMGCQPRPTVVCLRWNHSIIRHLGHGCRLETPRGSIQLSAGTRQKKYPDHTISRHSIHSP